MISCRMLLSFILDNLGHYWCHEVEVGKIDGHDMCTRCGNHTVEEYIDEEEPSRVGTISSG